MREHGLARITCRRRSLTRQDAKVVPPPDLIRRDFTAPAPGVRLVGNIIYLPIAEGRLYLATTIDLFNREVVGHAMTTRMRDELVNEAVGLAHRRGLLLRPRAVHIAGLPSHTLTSLEHAAVDGPERVLLRQCLLIGVVDPRRRRTGRR